MTEQVKRKKKQLSVACLVIGIVFFASFVLLILFHNVYAPDHPHFDSFAARYYGAMLISFIGMFAFMSLTDDLKEEISEKNWFVTYFIANAEAPPPFRYVVKAIDKEDVEVKFQKEYPAFKIIEISLK